MNKIIIYKCSYKINIKYVHQNILFLLYIIIDNDNNAGSYWNTPHLANSKWVSFSFHNGI